MDKDIPIEISHNGEKVFEGTTGDIHNAAGAARAKSGFQDLVNDIKESSTQGLPDNHPAKQKMEKMLDEIARRDPEYIRTLETAAEFPIPPRIDFGKQQFLPAPDLKVVGDMLIDKYRDFDHLVNLKANIVYLWKEKGGETGGRATLGKCIKPGGLTDYFACVAETAMEGLTDKVDFIVWAAADHLRNNNANFRTVCALIFHELKHASYNEKGDFVIEGHDFEGFAREIEEFGMWKTDIKLIAEACEGVKDVQQGLFTNMAANDQVEN